ncbi:hypothetical protein G6M89_07165 [Natronolimnobius sp. AArcel1]|uniref:hypothetical protein n=1 Tax=Natronolimnobius sp. AArcel1 TaxID=1679093 RepID=UPI0013ED9174|nr:hypothetical protein [Natronolimnobius sp. AArcel1]NGM68789.1 hypothetical protein [Natronolimnobius sp. AArcel1]
MAADRDGKPDCGTDADADGGTDSDADAGERTNSRPDTDDPDTDTNPDSSSSQPLSRTPSSRPCPACDARIVGVTVLGPTTAFARPCGCRVSPEVLHQLDADGN